MTPEFVPEALPGSIHRLLANATSLVIQVDSILDLKRRERGQLLNAELGPPARADVVHELTRLSRLLGLLRCAEAALFVARDLAESP